MQSNQHRDRHREQLERLLEIQEVNRFTIDEILLNCRIAFPNLAWGIQAISDPESGKAMGYFAVGRFSQDSPLSFKGGLVTLVATPTTGVAKILLDSGHSREIQLPCPIKAIRALRLQFVQEAFAMLRAIGANVHCQPIPEPAPGQAPQQPSQPEGLSEGLLSQRWRIRD